MSFVFAQKKKPMLVIGNQVMFPFGKWPFKCLIGVPKDKMHVNKDSRFVLEFGRGPRKRYLLVNDAQMHEIEKKICLKNPLSDEQVVRDVLRRDGCKQQVKQ